MSRSILLALLLTAACTSATAPVRTDIAERQGTIELNQGPPNDVALGGGGNGTVFFNGQTYVFVIGGLGVEGSGIALLQTTGQVYQLHNISDFPGTYRKTPSTAPGADLWLRNERGMLMRIAAPPEGRIPDIGSDAVRIELH